MSTPLPTYQNLFGTDNYYTVSDSRSVLSPAAYLVELIKLIDNNVRVDKSSGGIPIQTRRPDIYKIILDKINTENELPKLDIVNRILKEQVTENPSTATYPFSLPYNNHLEEIRHYLAQNKTSLEEIWKAFNKGYEGDLTLSKSIFLETLGISREQWDQFSADPAPGDLYLYYGYPSTASDSEVVTSLGEVQAFLSKTGLTQEQLHELVYEDLSEDEINNSQANYQGSFYINIGSSQPVSISGASLQNLNVTNTARLMRFVRMAQAMGWSFTDFDWALQTIRPLVSSRDEALPYLAWIQEQVSQNGLTVNQCCGFLGQIKDFGKKNGPCFYDSIFNVPANPKLPPVPGGGSYLTWNVPQPGAASPSAPEDKQIENALSAALQLNQRDLLKAVSPVVQYINNDNYELTLTPANLALLYRMSLLPKILNNPLGNIFSASKILSQKIGLTYCLQHNDYPVGNVLNVIDPTGNVLLTGQIAGISPPQKTDTCITYTITVATLTGNQNVQLVLDVQGLVFSSLSIGSTPVNGLTPGNVNQLVYTGLLIDNLLVSTSVLYSSTLYAVSQLDKLFSWIGSAPLSLGQLEFIILGSSNDQYVQNSIISKDSACNFISQLQSSIKKELVTQGSLYTAIINDVVQLYTTLVASSSFKQLIPGNEQQTINVLQSNVAEYCKWIIAGNSSAPLVSPVYNGLQSQNLVTVNGVIINDISEKVPQATITSIIENAVTTTINQVAGTDLSVQDIFSSPDPSTEVNNSLTGVVKRLAQYLHSAYINQQQALIHNLSGLYHTSAPIARALMKWGDLNLTEILSPAAPPKNPPQTLLDAMLPENVKENDLGEESIVQALEKLQQAALLITGLSLSPAEATFFKTSYAPTSLFPISLYSVKEIWKFKQLVKTFSDSQNNLLDIIQNPEAKDWQSKLAKLTGWNNDDLGVLTGSSYLTVTSPSIDAVYLLNKYFATATRLGIKVSSLWELGKLAVPTVTLAVSDNNFNAIAIFDRIEGAITGANVNQYVTVTLNNGSSSPLMNALSSLPDLIGCSLTIQDPSNPTGGKLVSGKIYYDTSSVTSDPATTVYCFYLNIDALASDLWGGLQAQLKSSPATLAKIQNKLSQKLRDKLVPLACYNLSSGAADLLSNYGANARGLYAYLLIDVEVSGAVQTTYIREAISAVQLYIYRCLNQLEPGTTVSSDLAGLWQWMQSYREWQANMEVFLYPENYIEPELRVEKTDLFNKAEHALKQADLTNPDSVEAIFRDYMNGFEEIGNLQVISCAARTYQDTGAEGPQNFKELCMVGIGPSGHGQYYYRLSKFRESASEDQYVPYDWGQWKKIAVTINTVEYQPGQYGIPKPIFAFGRWYIFWVEQSKYRNESVLNNGSSVSKTNYEYYSGSVHLSYLDFNKKWTPPQTILKVDFNSTNIAPAPKGTQSHNTTESYRISTRHEAEVQWLCPCEPTGQLEFRAFQTGYIYQPFVLPQVILGCQVQCIQLLNTAIFAGTRIGILEEDNDGHWERILCNKNVLCLGPNYLPYFAGTSNGLYSYSFCGNNSWEQVTGIPANVSVQTIVAINNESWLIGTSSGLYYYQTGTLQPVLQDNGIPGNADIRCCCVIYQSNGYLFQIGTSSGVYYAPEPDNLTFYNQNIGPVNFITYFAIQDGNYVAIAGTSNGVYVNCEITSSTYEKAGGVSGEAYCVAIVNGIPYVGTNEGLYYGTSLDFSPSFIQINDAVLGTPGVYCLSCNESYILAGTSNGLYYAPLNNITNGWQHIPQIVNINCIYYDGTSNWYVGTSNGLYTTTSSDFPNNWTLIPLPYSPVQPAIPPSTVYGKISRSISIQGEPGWFIVNGQKDQYLNISYPPGNAPASFNVYRLNSTAIYALGALLNAPDGINALLTINAQKTPESLFESLGPVNTYIPAANYPLDVIDLSNKSAMRMYYWELFFHLPFLIANELNKQQHFAHAKLWYEYIFNPLITRSSVNGNDKYWRFLGLRASDNPTLANELTEGELTELRKDLHNALQVYASDSEPFDPQAIAQLRPIAYQKTIVMHYINNLLSWGDMLYKENTRDSINEAEMLYVLAYNLLGTQPQDLGPEPLVPEADYTHMTGITCLGDDLLGTNIGLYRLDTSNSWIPVSLPGLQSVAITCLAYDGSSNYYAGTKSNGLFSSTDKQNWIRVSGVSSTVTVTCMYFGSFNGCPLAFAGTDCGMYQQIKNEWQIPVGSTLSTASITCLLQDNRSNSSFLFAGTANGFFYLSGQCKPGLIWYSLFDTLPVTCILPTGLSAYFGTVQNGLYIGNSTEYANRVGPADNWPYPSAHITSLYKDPASVNNNDGQMYAGTEGSGLFYFVQSSQSWQPVSSIHSIDTLTINCLIRHSAKAGLLYAGTSNGLYYMDEASGNWQPVQQFILSFAAVSILYQDSNNNLFVVSNQGLWSLSSANAGMNNFEYVPVPLHYFGIPRNQQFLNYWSEVKQRIYNIRHGLTITGQTDNLPLFSPPINPMDMVEAVGSGESVAEAMQLHNSTVPYYRFEVMIEKAKGLTAAVVQFGQSLLSALQTKDAQKLAELYNKNEKHILALTQSARQDNLQYAQQTLAALQQGLISAQNRQAYYAQLIAAGLSATEKSQVNLASQAITAQDVIEAIRVGAVIGYSMPTIFGFSDGGFHPGDAISQGAAIAEGVGSIFNQQSGLAGINAGYQRRLQDWQLQAQLAQDDINQINYQVVAAQYQVDLAQQDINMLQKQIEQQHKVAEFYKNKFTNEQLYSWYLGQLSGLYFQAYQLAHEVALQAENAWRFEHIGLPFSDQKDNFIKPGYWNSLYEGLLTGESLQLDLLRMEKSYMDQNVRRFEISKTISLAQLDPVALNNLITTGTCQFDITENDYAWDYPGHYCRKIKSISISIPMVVGPYQDVHAMLTQTGNKLVNSDGPDGQNAAQYLLNPYSTNNQTGTKLSQGNTAIQSNLIPNQQIALSQGVNDTGMFQLSFNDPRYLPFEGTGAVSSWQLDLPIAENAINYSSITDVIIQVDYTALQGSSNFRNAVLSSRQDIYGIHVKEISSPSNGMSFQLNAGNWIRVTPDSTVKISNAVMALQTKQSSVSGLAIEISDGAAGNISFVNWSGNQSPGSQENFNIPVGIQNLTLNVQEGTLPGDLIKMFLIIQYQVKSN